ncbi:MAG: hypothetical protein ABSD74_09760 [Rhizomicrobium sp.]
MAQEIHYEIFRRLGSKGGWTLHDVAVKREAALAMAEDLMAGEKATGVKVVKETYWPDTGEYLSLKIFEDGHTKHKVDAAAEDVPHALPCFKPDDLYSYHARATMARLLHEYLSRHKLTVTELIHRADALERLEATGTIYQHAIQKIAIAQASSTSTPVAHIIKGLNELTERSVHRVYRDTRRGYFPAGRPGEFGALAKKLSAAGDGAYQLNGTIARVLAEAQSWNEKLLILLAMVNEAPADGAGRTLLLGVVDALIAEILGSAAALHELIGETENLGEALMVLIELFLSRSAVEDQATPLSALARHFAADMLPDSRTAVACRIVAELRSMRRLCPASLQDELRLLRQIANRLVLGQGKYLSHEELIAAFTLRSRRIVAHESVAEHLAEATLPDEKLERLLLIEENLVGAENKRQLAAFVLPILTSATFEAQFLAPKSPVLTRLKRLAELQTRVRRSAFPERQRDELAGHLDRLAVEAEARAKLLHAIDEKTATPVERAVAFLKLFAAGTFTEGRLAEKARALVLAQLAQPGFFTAYVSQLARSTGQSDADSAMASLMQMLEKAGIAPETGLKSLAA